MKFVDVESDDPRLASDVWPVLRQLRHGLTSEVFATIYREGYPQGLRFLAVYRDRRCVGVAGWRVVATTANTRKLYVDDLVVDEVERRSGVGAALLAELRQRAKALGCQLLDLDSGVQRADAHRFYMRERLTITSLHFAEILAEPDCEGVE